MTHEVAAYIKALTEWYADRVKDAIGGGAVNAQGDPGSSPPPPPPPSLPLPVED